MAAARAIGATAARSSAYDDPGRARLAPARCRSAPRSTGWRRRSPAPVVFIALHGPFGEDGTVQALLEAAGLAYTGSGVAASAIGMDKTLFKRMCRGIGLPVVDWREVRGGPLGGGPGRRASRAGRVRHAAPDPRLMVKPARLGSSVGMTLVHDPSELDAALDEAFRHDTLALVETYLAGARDLEVAILGNGQAPRAVRARRDRLRATSSTTTRRSTPPACPRRRPAPR